MSIAALLAIEVILGFSSWRTGGRHERPPVRLSRGGLQAPPPPLT